MSHMLFKENENSTVVSRILSDESLFALEGNSGIIADEIPAPLNNGKIYVLHVDESTGALWYEYHDVPKSDMDILKERLDATEQALLQIMMEGLA